MNMTPTVIGRTHRRWILLVAGSAFSAFLSLSCDESLPPREAPPVVLTSSVEILRAGQSLLIRNNQPYSSTGAIQIRVTNIYDEVLEDSSVLEGRAEIWMKDQPDVRATVLMTESDLLSWNVLNRGFLTIKVDTTVRLLKQWSHRTDAGIPFWDFVRLYPGATIDGEPYCASKPITMVIRCSLRVFKSYGQIQFPDKEFQLSYEVFGIECQ